MALKLQPTLADMRSEVLAGLNMGVQGEMNADLHPLIDRMLRQAQASLWNRFPWLQNKITTVIALTQAVTQYDIPDSFEPGSISRIFARAAGTIVAEWDLIAGISPDDRTFDSRSTPPFSPYRYEIRDTVIVVHPAPGENPGSIVLEMESGLSPLTGETDRPSCNGEACIQLATILVKEQRRMPVGDQERALHQQFVMDLRPKQSVGKVFTIGTDYVHPSEQRRSKGRYYDDLDYWRGGP